MNFEIKQIDINSAYLNTPMNEQISWKPKPGTFLGYSENPSAYKILDITTNKIILSRTVAFFESNSGNSFLKECSPEISNFIPDHEIRGDNTYYNKKIYDTYTYDINHNIQQKLNKINYSSSNKFFNPDNILNNSPILNNNNIQNIYEDIINKINKNNSKNKRKNIYT